MREKTVIGLAIVTLPLLAAAILVPPPGGTAPPPVATGLVFPSLGKWLGGVATIAVTGSDGPVTLVRTAPAASDPHKLPVDGWGLKEEGGYPVPPDKVRPILTELLTLREVAPKTARPKLYARLDLDNPGKGSQANELTLADAKGAPILKLVVGKRKDDPLGAGHDGIYIRKPGDARSWLVRPPISLPLETLDWIDRTIVDVQQDKVKEIALTPDGGKALVLKRDKAADKLAIQDLPKGAKLRNDDPGADVAAGFSELDLDAVKPAGEVTGKPAWTARLTTFDGMTLDLTLYKEGADAWATVAATGTGDGAKAAAAIAARTKGWAYKLPAGRAATIESRLADLEAPEAKPAVSEKKKAG